ncbi:MAG: FAD-binding protein [Lachnospiraceae bacterium]|nr:FAD-binding protein [Lachnospiraceae bacterium]
MIRISGIKVDIGQEGRLLKKAASILKVSPDVISDFFIIKKSLDARDKDHIHYSYIVDVCVNDEDKILRRCRNPKVSISKPKNYKLPEQGSAALINRPVVVGSGPAGLFAAYFLAQNGYKPILLERGADVNSRIKKVNDFWNNAAPLDPETNIQFGEGGAGTFSDGKLNTGVNDPSGRNKLVLETFVANGGPREILCSNKPHLGTDVLMTIVKNMRNYIVSHGGDVMFNSRFDDFRSDDDRLESISYTKDGVSHDLRCSNLILATGHSARDTFKMLFEAGINMQGKPFAVGIRAVHDQDKINRIQYGPEYKEKYGNKLPPADYKLTYRADDGKSVFSFCMCPGGFVVDSSSEPGHLCINGMSYSGRDGEFANSAIIVSVSPEDVGSDTVPMKGIEFQRDLERKAFECGNGHIPAQYYGDFVKTVPSKGNNAFSGVKGGVCYTDLNKVLPEFVSRDIKEAMPFFGTKMSGYDDDDTLILAVESRTSSPVRIVRDDHFESCIKGIYPCGEGAGYAGGIASAAIDGIKVFEEIYKRYHPL